MKNDEISSTEKLLDLIRNDNNTATDFSHNVSPQGQGTNKKPLGRQPAIFNSQKATTLIGVDLGYHEIRLTRAAQAFKGKTTLQAYRSIPYAPDIPKNSPRFPSFLGEALNDFCSLPAKDLQIWTILSAAKIEIRHLLIPKVQTEQLPGTIFWAFKKEVPFNEKDSIFDFEVQGEVADQGTDKIAVLAYIAPRSEVETLLDIFAKSGYPLTGVTTTPFATQNLFRTNWSGTDATKVICNLYIGRQWSRIDIFAEGKLVSTRGIKTGMHSMASELMLTDLPEGETSPAILTAEPDAMEVLTIPPPAEAEAISMEMALEILDAFNEDATSTMMVAGKSLHANEIFAIIEPAVERLTRQLERTFDYFATTFPGKTVSKTYLCGLMGSYSHLLDHIKEQLGIPCQTIDPFAAEIPHLSEVSPPDTASQKATYTIATGLALSNNDWTPNFLFTHKEKAAQIKAARIEKLTLSSLLLIALLCVGIFFYQSQRIDTKKQQLAKIEQQLARYDVAVDQDQIVAMKNKLIAEQIRLKNYRERYLGTAIFSELSAITPQTISLSSCTFAEHTVQKSDRVRPAKKTQAKSAEPSSLSHYINMQGVVSGPRQELNATLTLYRATLAGSPLFSEPMLSRNEIITHKGNKVLVFTITMNVL